MKNPLWIATSALIALLLTVIGAIIFTYRPLPSKKTLSGGYIDQQGRQEFSQVSPAQIYENDLFNTTFRIPEKQEPQAPVAAMPMPPAPQPVVVAAKKQTAFLPPLNITLKGIMYTANQDQNSAIIADNKTKQEQLYHIGDRIEDADIIYIDRHKIIVLRSNGQQETMYVTPTDASNDPAYQRNAPWSKVVKQIEPSLYQVDAKALIKRIPNVSQMIEMLDLTTAYQQGRSLGCMIGSIAPQSIGTALGFESGDIITRINDIPTTTTKDRTTIYQSIKNMIEGDQIMVTIIRKNQELTNTYKLQRIKAQESPEPRLGSVLAINKSDSNTSPRMEEQRTVAKTINKDSARFEQSARTLRVNDRRRMQNGNKKTLLQRFSGETVA
jgi:type II secretion system protein C